MQHIEKNIESVKASVKQLRVPFSGQFLFQDFRKGPFLPVGARHASPLRRLSIVPPQSDS